MTKLADTRLILAVVVVMALVAAIACSSADEPAPAVPAAPAPAPAPAATSQPAVAPPAASSSGGTLVVAMAKIGAPTGLPGRQTGGGPEQMPQRLSVMERLTERIPDLSYSPMLAESFTLADDLTKITVNLRQGVKFHDDWGNLTAEDVKWSYGDAALENPESIHGSVGFINNHLEPLVVLDTNTLEFPVKEFTTRWQGIHIGIVDITSKKRVDELGEDEALQRVVGTGPFKMDSWTADNEFIGERFEDYWGKQPSFDTLRVRQVPEASTRVALIKTGEAGIIDAVPINFLKDLKDSNITPINDHRGGRQQAIFFGGNFWQKKYHDRDEDVPPRPGFLPDDDHPWIGNPDDPERDERARKVRLALSLSINRELINEQVLLGEGSPEYVPYLATFHPEHPDRWVYPFDPDKATQLLDEAGYGDGFEVPMFVAPDIGSLNQEVYEAVATMWANIGLTPRLDRTAYQAFRPRLVERKLDFLYAWSGDNETTPFDEPRFAAAEGSTWSENDWNYGIEVLNTFQAMEKVNAAPTDKAARVQANLEMGDFFFDTVIGIGVVMSPNPMYFNPEVVTSWSALPGDRFNFESVTLK